METQQNSFTLPAEYVVDYEALLHDAGLEGTTVVLYLLQHLPFKWRDLYVAAASRPTNIVRFSCRSFEHIFDLYSELELMGEVPYEQTVEDRVVAVFGTSARPDESRDGIRMRGWLGETGEIPGRNSRQRAFHRALHRRWSRSKCLLARPKTQQRMVASGENLSPDGKILPRTSRHFLLLASHLRRHVERPSMARIRSA